MLTNVRVTPTLPVVDMERARKFYEEKLGLKVARVDPPPVSGVLYQAGGDTRLYLYQRGATKADHTVVTFNADNADDVEAQVKELKSKGVVFLDLDMPDMGVKTVDGVATMGQIKASWFTDTEGNILGIANM